MTTTKRPYTKRYERPANPPNFELTPRAIRINTEICRRPLIRKDQLRKLFPEITDRPFDQIVSNLFKNGFIARPPQQQAADNPVSYLTPDRRGVQLHRSFFADPVPAPIYTQKNTRGTWSYIRHQHTTTSTLLQYQTAAVNLANTTFFPEHQLWTTYARDAKQPASPLYQPNYNLNDYPRLMARDFITNPPPRLKKKTPKTPLTIKTHLEWITQSEHTKRLGTETFYVSTRPDAYFALQNHQTNFFFLESDEGTETIIPGDHVRHSAQLFEQTSLLAKYLVYFAAYRKRSHQKQFGIPKFSVITVTTTPRRSQQIIEKIAPYFKRDLKNINHSDLFLFTDRLTISNFNNNPYHPQHRHKNLAGQDVSLITV